jgi:predicted transcriptional regulator
MKFNIGDIVRVTAEDWNKWKVIGAEKYPDTEQQYILLKIQRHYVITLGVFEHEIEFDRLELPVCPLF